MWFQKQLTLPAASRGSYLVTDRITSQLPELSSYRVGLLHLFVQHTSCALSLNENWDEDVREDMTDALERIAPYEGKKGEELYRHNAEGRDDMPVCTMRSFPSLVAIMRCFLGSVRAFGEKCADANTGRRLISSPRSSAQA